MMTMKSLTMKMKRRGGKNEKALVSGKKEKALVSGKKDKALVTGAPEQGFFVVSTAPANGLPMSEDIPRLSDEESSLCY